MPGILWGEETSTISARVVRVTEEGMGLQFLDFDFQAPATRRRPFQSGKTRLQKFNSYSLRAGTDHAALDDR